MLRLLLAVLATIAARPAVVRGVRYNVINPKDGPDKWGPMPRTFDTLAAAGKSCVDWHGPYNGYGWDHGRNVDCYKGCMDSRPVLTEFGDFGRKILEQSAPHTGDHPCRVQNSFCKSICHREACPTEYRQCQAALHHVKHMVFDAPGWSLSRPKARERLVRLAFPCADTP